MKTKNIVLLFQEQNEVKLTLPRWESCKTLGQQILNPWVLLPCLGYVYRMAERNQCQWTSHGTKPEEHKNRQNNAKDTSVLNMTTFCSLCPWNLTAKGLNQPEYHDCQYAELAFANRSYRQNTWYCQLKNGLFNYPSNDTVFIYRKITGQTCFLL